MSENFDPYYEWLGIPPKHQPPHHYRLLGLELFEQNANVIERAADRQMAHVRTFQSGKHATHSQSLLNELSAAKICLLTPHKRSEYDARLQSQLVEPDSPPECQPAIVIPDARFPKPVPRISRTSVRRPVRVTLIVGAVAAISLAAVFAFVLSQVNDGKRRPPTQSPPQAAHSSPKTREKDETASEASSPVLGTKQDSPSKGFRHVPALPPLDETPDSIADPGTGAILVEVPEALRQRISDASGMIDSQFAICQTLPIRQFIDVAQELRPLGYRPIRCRPYVAGGELQVAAVWRRDGLPWRMAAGVDQAGLQLADERMKVGGFVPAEVAGYAVQAEQYLAIWYRPTHADGEFQLCAGLLPADFTSVRASLLSQGYGLLTYHAFRGDDGRNRCSGVAAKTNPATVSEIRGGGETEYAASLASAALPADVTLSLDAGGAPEYQVLLKTEPATELREYHGGSLDEHRARCAEFAKEGFQPVALSVIHPPAATGPLAASVWSKPATDTSGTAVAAQQPMPPAAARSVAVRLSGRQSLAIDNSAALADFRQPFTVETWFRLATLIPPTGSCLLGKATSGESAGVPSALTGWLVVLRSTVPQASSPDQVVVRWGADAAQPLEAQGTFAPLGTSWHHLALCCTPPGEDGGEFRVWLDGQSVVHQKHQARGETTAALELGVPDRYAADLVTLIDVRAFRLSSTVRYTSDFTPDRELAKDDAVICLLDFHSEPGDQLADLAGNGHGGRIVGGERVEVESPPFAPSPEFMAGLPSTGLDPRLPVPDEAAVAQAAAQLRETYKKELAGTREPADMVALSAEMLRKSREPADVPAQYALLVEARNLATSAGNVHFALRAVRALTDRFQLDPWGAQAEVLGKVVSAAKTVGDRKAAAEVAIALLDESVRGAAIESAEKIASSLVQVSRRLKDPLITRVANLRTREVSLFRKMKEQAAAAQATLARDTNDPEANSFLGRYLCFLASDWPAGIRHLAEGKDAALRELARNEQAAPTAAEDQVALADAWLIWAKTADEFEQNAAWLRAQHWLEKAMPNLAGLDQTKVGGQLAELSTKAAPQAAGTSGSLGDWLSTTVGEVRWFNAHSGAVTAMTSSRSGRWILSGALDSRLRVWDAFSGSMLGEMQTTVNGVSSLALSTDERAVLVAGSRDAIELWSVVKRQPVREFKLDASVRDLTLAQDGQLLAFAKPRRDKNIVFADPGTLLPLRELDYPAVPTGLALSHSGKLVAVASERGGLVLASLETGKSVPLSGHQDPVVDLAFSPNERWLASVAASGIIVWDLSTGKAQHRLTTTGPAGRVAFTPDGTRLLSSNSGGQLAIWNVIAGTALETLQSPDGMRGATQSLTVLPHGLGAACGDANGVISLWRLPE